MPDLQIHYIADCPEIPQILYYIIPIAILMVVISAFGVWNSLSEWKDWKDWALLIITAINGGTWLCLILALLLFG